MDPMHIARRFYIGGTNHPSESRREGEELGTGKAPYECIRTSTSLVSTFQHALPHPACILSACSIDLCSLRLYNHQHVPVAQMTTPRVKTTLACDTCRRRKSRCDGTRPLCGHCQSAGLECVYRPTPTTLEAWVNMHASVYTSSILELTRTKVA